MPRTQAQLEEVKSERRAQILDAAREIFALRGFEPATIADVAEHCGISHGLLYHYFPTKESLFAAIVERSMEAGLALVDEAERGASDPWQTLARVVELMLEGVREEPATVLVVVQALSSQAASPGVRSSVQRSEDAILRRLAALIERCQAAEAVTPGDAAARAVALLAIVQGLAIHRVSGSDFAAVFPDVRSVLALLKA
ncbi:MAG: TetR/AcrR family transcriptional regulator [Candidatus Limnocylindria bacterium]